MPKIKYKTIRFRQKSLDLIEHINDIVNSYRNQGYSLTLRQVYYQLVSRNIISNSEKSYSNIGGLINDGRLAGLIDWKAIEDRTRNLRMLAHWSSPANVIKAAAQSYRLDKWEDQPKYVECFVPGTPVILTSGSFIPIETVEIGDSVITHTGDYQYVYKTIENQYSGDLIELSIASLPTIKLTPNHPLFVRQMDRTKPGYKGSQRVLSEPSWIKADKLQKNDYVGIPIPKRMGSSRINPPRITYTTHKQKRLKDINRIGLQEVIGAYLANGSIRQDKRTLQFTLNANDEFYSKTIVEWATAIGASTRTDNGPGTKIVYVHSKALADWFEKYFGNGAYNKRLPYWVMFGKWEDISKLLKGYFDGDGCLWDESNSTITAGSRSKQLIQQIQMKLLWHGYIGSYHVVQDHGNPMYRIRIGGASVEQLAKEWSIEIPIRGNKRSKRYNHCRIDEDGKYIWFPIKDITIEQYSGPVYNLEVENDHSYLTPIASHNCWVEKDALIGIVQKAADAWDVPYFSCRGYTSQSEIWAAAQRLIEQEREFDKETIIIHLGDHDPSGKDMTRDIEDRLHMFGSNVQIDRIALNMNQIQQYNLPPNPAKITDSRASKYIEEFGNSSWELDALQPSVLDNLIQGKIQDYLDDILYFDKQNKETKEQNALYNLSDKFRDGEMNIEDYYEDEE